MQEGFSYISLFCFIQSGSISGLFTVQPAKKSVKTGTTLTSLTSQLPVTSFPFSLLKKRSDRNNLNFFNFSTSCNFFTRSAR
jgi:hypothetical protein